MTIPANSIVSVNPGVISGGGSPLSLNGVILSQSDRLPTGAVRTFTSPESVSAFFGSGSSEYAAALIYFLGYDNSTIKPGTLLFAPFVADDRAAWVQSGSLAGMTLEQLKALSGVLTVTVDGVVKTSDAIDLAAATSFSNAATLIAAEFTAGPSVVWDPVQSVFVITSPTDGESSTIGYVSGTLSTGLKLTEITGAIVSQGADEDSPTTCMDMVKSVTQNWVSFMTLWEPLTADKTLFAEWVTAQNQRFAYIVWDSDAQAIVDGSSTCFGVLANVAEYDGVVPVYNNYQTAAFLLGAIACIDFSRLNARITVAFKSQPGFIPVVTDKETADILTANGYSFYGVYATANDRFNFFYNGQMPGKWKWVDPYINQIYLSSQFQLSLMVLLTSIGSIPYNQAGYALIRAAMQDPIYAGLNFGLIRSGVLLSSAQKGLVNQAAGLDVATIIEQQGYYLQVLDPGAQVRANRGTPVINFWYTDGGAVQHISLASIDIM